MKRTTVLVIVLGLVASELAFTACAAAQTETNSAAVTEAQGRYLSLIQREAELKAQHRLLTQLSELHTGRAEAARNASQSDLSAWENELVRDLTSRATKISTELATQAKERASMESSAPLGALSSGVAGSRTNATYLEAAAYMAKLQQRMSETEEELAAVAELSNLFVSQLQTNNTPEEVSRISFQVDRQTREMRNLKRELSDLDLRRLEFRALQVR